MHRQVLRRKDQILLPPGHSNWWLINWRTDHICIATEWTYHYLMKSWMRRTHQHSHHNHSGHLVRWVPQCRTRPEKVRLPRYKTTKVLKLSYNLHKKSVKVKDYLYISLWLVFFTFIILGIIWTRYDILFFRYVLSPLWKKNPEI